MASDWSLRVAAGARIRRWMISGGTTKRKLAVSRSLILPASLAIVRYCRSHAPFCRGTCGEIV
eukprot:4694765-Pleurochrysis_carterae.AAC.1